MNKLKEIQQALEKIGVSTILSADTLISTEFEIYHEEDVDGQHYVVKFTQHEHVGDDSGAVAEVVEAVKWFREKEQEQRYRALLPNFSKEVKYCADGKRICDCMGLVCSR